VSNAQTKTKGKKIWLRKTPKKPPPHPPYQKKRGGGHLVLVWVWLFVKKTTHPQENVNRGGLGWSKKKGVGFFFERKMGGKRKGGGGGGQSKYREILCLKNQQERETTKKAQTP